MSKILHMEITRCKQCPYYRWEPNEGCGNWAGNSLCVKDIPDGELGKLIKHNGKDPEIPVTCTLTEKVEKVEKEPETPITSVPEREPDGLMAAAYKELLKR